MDPPHGVTDNQATTMVKASSLQLNSKEELRCLLQTIKVCKNKCLRNTVALESLKECIGRSEKHHLSVANENNLPATVMNKVARLMCVERLYGNVSVVDSGEHMNNDSLNLLGLPSEFFTNRRSGLLELEKQLVRTMGENHLLRKQRRLPPKKYSADKASDSKDIREGTVLSGVVLQYSTFLHDHWTELKQLLDMRECLLQQILPQKVACLGSQFEMCQAQKRCLDAALLDIILNEVPKFSKSLKFVYRQMREDNDELVLEIDRQKNLWAAYQNLKGTRFDMLLQNYKTVLKEIEHTNWGLHNLK